METSGTNNIAKNTETNIQTADNRNKLKQCSAEKEKVVLELIDMGFSKSLVLQVLCFNN